MKLRLTALAFWSFDTGLFIAEGYYLSSAALGLAAIYFAWWVNKEYS